MSKEDGINPKQALFCQYYVTADMFANGTEAYAKAYGKDLKNPSHYATCRAEASRLLTNPNILNKINELLDLSGLNDAFVDKQLTLLITQNADMGAKIAAIREYNKLKQRITDKLNISGDFNITLDIK